LNQLEAFKDLNAPAQANNSLNLGEVRPALLRELDWHFLPAAAIDVVDRFGLNTIDSANMLLRYRYVEPNELAAMLKYATGLQFVYVGGAPALRCEKFSGSSVLVSQAANGVDYTAYIAAHKPVSEADLKVHLPGNAISVCYLLPDNFDRLANSDFDACIPWDYYTMFGRYMQYALEHKASDVHFEVLHTDKEPTYRVMCRIGPDREECRLFALNARINHDLISETISKRSRNSQALLDLDAGIGVVASLTDIFHDGRLEVRLAAERVSGGYYCVCRLQEVKTTSLPLSGLGFDDEVIKALREALRRPSGLTVITGKIRTGKNTTMASLVNDLASMDTHPSILSFDDPIEIIGSYPQIDYRGEVDLLKAGIRLAKKMDLDYVTLNEIPNAEVAFGVRDLVNSSVHTLTTWHMNRVWHLPHKLFEYFGGSYRDLLSQMNVVCNQRLYKMQCPHCLGKMHRSLYKEKQPKIHDFFLDYNLEFFMVSQGCEMCSGSGFLKGRVVVIPEIIVFTQELVLKLLGAQHPHEMEILLMNEMRGSSLSLEHQMCKALKEGRLSPYDVLSII
jgi:type II secretory ATPase GspE/PulE/Tfp pilus assembly ATPase PilB-like protein